MENKYEERSANFEVRADAESRTITGTAAVYDQWTTIGGFFEFKEKVSRGAFDDSLKKDEIVATFNHNFDNVLARTGSETLKVWSDTKGLHYSFDAPNTTIGDDMLENIRNKNVNGGSIMFRIEEQTWKWSEDEKTLDERTISKGSLVELGPVTKPAYKQTSVSAKRSKEDHDTEAKDALDKAKEEESITLTLQLQRKRG